MNIYCEPVWLYKHHEMFLHGKFVCCT